ncbi:MAG: hypothetical protein L6R42_007389, partial [Xanthoria sp. 1 TBL-2021]
MPATHMATRPGLPARHSSLFPQMGWFPSSRRNALVAIDQDPVPPTSHSEPVSPSGASAASSFSQWSPTPLNRWAMATATIKHGAHKLLHRDRSATTDAPPVDNEKCQQEKQFIADFCENAKPLAPNQIADSPRNKQLATSSHQLRIQDFELIKTLGTGTFARVWLATLAGGSRNSNDCRVFALKILRKTDIIRLKQVEHIRNERRTLAAVAGHPFITTLVTTFSDRDSLYMLLDYCPGGEVFSYLRKAKKFDVDTARFYAAEIVLILEFLHTNQGIAYRDMKPENILIDAEGHIKLVDFGFAKKVDARETYTLCGTPEYLAPEVIKNSGHGTAVDWWAFGILVYEFLVGQPPFWHQNPMKNYE